MNSQAQAIINRIAFLKQAVENIDPSGGVSPEDIALVLDRANHVGLDPTPINEQSGLEYRLAVSDAYIGAKLAMNRQTPSTVRIPDNSTVPMPIGVVINGYQKGQGTTVFAPDTDNVIINSASSLQTASQYSEFSLTKTGTNEWLVTGQLSTTKPPVNTSPPIISGDPTQTQGSVLSVNNGLWQGSPAPTFTYQWLRDGANISGATSASYATVVGDNTKTVSVRVTGTNANGASAAVSNGILIAAQVGSPPVNTVAPAISGSLTSGSTLTTTNGTWTGSLSFTIQWRRDGAPISAAVNSTYVLSDGDVGHSITALVTGTNADGSVSALSNAVTPTAVAPVNLTRPVITGTGTVGSELTASNGTWAGSPSSYAYQWQRNSTNITGATSATYRVEAVDAGTNITVVVVATNGSGATGQSSLNLPISGATPINTTAPGITGIQVSGNVLSVDVGTWSNNPTFAYQWRRNGVNIAGATASTYLTTGADGDTIVSVLVTGTNTAGSTAVPAPGVNIDMASGLPVNTSPPTITGSTPVGSVLTCTPGSWTNNPAFSFQWFIGASPISGATSTTYTTIQAQNGSAIFCRVTATNGSGSPTANSNSITVGTAGGSINSLSVVDNGSTPINLTAVGTVDWRKFNTLTVASQEQMNSAAGINSLTMVTPDPLIGSGGSTQTISWTNGTTSGSGSRPANDAQARDIGGTGGKSVAAECVASTTQRTLRMYMVLFNCSVTYTASLSDGSASSQSVTIATQPNSYKSVTLTVTFSSSGSGTFTVNGAMTSLGTLCGCSLDAAALS